MCDWRANDGNVTVTGQRDQCCIELGERDMLPDAATNAEPEGNERALLEL